MSAEHAQREPTMEAILASIRRIISEEDKPDSAGEVLDLQPTPPTPPPAAPVVEMKAPPPAPKPVPPPEPIVAKAPPPQIFDEPEEIAPPKRPIEEDLM